MENELNISKFDATRRKMRDVALFCKPSTIKNIDEMTGKTETFIIETAHQADLGNYVFLERFDDNPPVRIVIPPKVANIIASQREALSSRKRSISSRKVMAERIAAGHDPAKALREYHKRKKKK